MVTWTESILCIERISRTLRTIATDKKGYRNNEWGEERIWSLKDIVYHEMTVLMNSDIPEFLNEQYGAKICQDKDGNFDQKAFEHDAPCYYQDVITFINDKMGKDNLYAVWLTTIKGVCEFYNSGSETTITTYHIPDDTLVISDLDEDGSLFVTAIHPDELIESYGLITLLPSKHRVGVG